MNRAQTTRIAMLLTVSLLAFPHNSFAQQTTGAIRGAATDPSGTLVPGVQVTATNDATGASQTVHTDSAGNYAFPLLPPGLYTVTTEAAGFKKSISSNVLVRITETQILNFTLQIGVVTESITVNEQGSLLQTDTSSEGKV